MECNECGRTGKALKKRILDVFRSNLAIAKKNVRGIFVGKNNNPIYLFQTLNSVTKEFYAIRNGHVALLC
jgi:hypothetical protein